MISILAVATTILFGGVPFGTSEQALRAKVARPMEEQVLGDGSRALITREMVAGREAQRKWIIRNDTFAEGVLLFSFDGEKSECERLQREALASLMANYGAEPKPMQEGRRPTGMLDSELWTVSLEDGSRIEQRMLYVPLIKSCSVSGRYSPPVTGSTAF